MVAHENMVAVAALIELSLTSETQTFDFIAFDIPVSYLLSVLNRASGRKKSIMIALPLYAFAAVLVATITTSSTWLSNSLDIL